MRGLFCNSMITERSRHSVHPIAPSTELQSTSLFNMPVTAAARRCDLKDSKQCGEVLHRYIPNSPKSTYPAELNGVKVGTLDSRRRH